MLKVDHIAIAVKNLFAGYMDFTRETGLEVMSGGYYPNNGLANVLIPTNDSTFIEIESIIEYQTPTPAQLFIDASVNGPKFVGLCLRVDSLEELQENADRIGAKVDPTGPLYYRYNGEPHPPQPRCMIDNAWAQDEPGYYLMDMDHHVGNVQLRHKKKPNGFSWIEIGGTEKRATEMLGVHPDELNIRCNGSEDRGIWAVAVASDDGDIEIRYPR